jgi:AraC-like DNA-binding protein
MAQMSPVAGPSLPIADRIEPSRLIGFRPLRPLVHVRWHVHDFYELSFITAGSGRHITASGERKVAPGSVVFVQPEVGHGFRLCHDMTIYQCFLRAKAADISALWLARDPRLEALIGIRASPANATPIILDLEPDDMEACLAHLDDVRLRPRDERTPAGDMGRLLLVLDLLARRLPPAGPVGAGRDRSAPVLVSAALNWFEQDLAYPWTLAELSRRLSVHPDHLCRAFSRWSGVPPMTFLSHRRADVAASLLVSSTDLIASIGAAVGWKDPPTFSRAFSRWYGMSPRDYRTRSAHAGPEPAPDDLARR